MATRQHDISQKIAQSGQNMGNMRKKTVQKSKPPAKVNKRPPPPPEVKEISTEVSEEIRANIRSIVDAESQFDDGMTLNQLGKLMNYSSAHIYTVMKGRNEIGILTVCRFSYALGCDPWLLLMPNEDFKKQVIPNYIRYRKGLSDGSDVKPKRRG